MKKKYSILILFVFFLMTANRVIQAQQIKTPRPSPTATLSQNVGLTDITITYSRPSVKNRVIFGDLLPFGTLWRTGANLATRLEFNDDVIMEGHQLKAGIYSLFTIPGKDEWTIILNSNYKQAGTTDYKESEDVLRFNVKPVKLSEQVETLRIDINNIRNSSCTIDIAWESTLVSLKIDLGTDAKVLESIKQAMDPASDANKYYTAANYYYNNDKDLNQSLEWVNRSISLSPESLFSFYLKSNILAKMGNFKDAIAAAKLSKDLAMKNKNDEFVSMNDKNIALWQSMK